MKYELMLRSRVDPNQSIEEKHQDLISGLLQMRDAWGPITKELPKAPDPKTQLIAITNLTRYFGKGIRGQVSYQYRGNHLLRDDAMNDDHFLLEFNPEEVDYECLVKESFLHYLSAFRPYLAYIENEELLSIDFRDEKKMSCRDKIYRINPVFFVDRELSQKVFNCSPEQLVDKLKGHVEGVKIVFNGVLVIASSKVLTLEESDAVNRRLKTLLITS
jgi:hypothetical protein